MRLPSEQTLPNYSQFWVDREYQHQGHSKDITINGFPGATATAKGDHWSLQLFALFIGSDVYSFIFAAKKMTPKLHTHCRKSVSASPGMSIAESNAAKPQRVRIVTVADRDTVQMAITGRRSIASDCSMVLARATA